MLELIAVLVVVGLLLWFAPRAPRSAPAPAAECWGYRVDARQWPLIHVARGDAGHFRSFDGVRWFRWTPGQFARVGGGLVQVERERFEELNWDEAHELIDWLRSVFERHGTTFFDVGAQRLLLETDNGRSQKTA